MGRGYYERLDRAAAEQAYRNGYRQTTLETAGGKIIYDRPLVTGAPEFKSSFHVPHMRKLKEFQNTIADLYVNGVSTRKVKKALKASAGADAKITKSTVSRVAKRVREEFAEWKKRDLSELKVVYLFLDAIRIGIRLDGAKKQAVLVAYGVMDDGSFAPISIGVGHSESNDSWGTFLRDMKARGLTDPLLTISDGNQGVIASIDAVFPLSWRQRCVRHKIENVLGAVPKEDHEAVRADLDLIFYGATSLEQARQALGDFRRKYKKVYPSAIDRLESDLEQTLTYYIFPACHWRRIRTSNSLERLNLEIRRRMNVIGRHPHEDGCLSLVFAVAMGHADRNRAFKATEIIQSLWQRLRDKKEDLVWQLQNAVIEKKAA
jgi:transposase-like protein